MRASFTTPSCRFARSLGTRVADLCSKHRLKLDRLEEKEKYISIWARDDKNGPQTLLMEAFSCNAAMLFSEVWNKQLNKNRENGGGYGALFLEGIDINSCKRILDWINLCVDEGNDVKFPEASVSFSSRILTSPS